MITVRVRRLTERIAIGFTSQSHAAIRGFSPQDIWLAPEVIEGYRENEINRQQTVIFPDVLDFERMAVR